MFAFVSGPPVAGCANTRSAGVGEPGGLREPVEDAADLVGHRHRPGRPSRLRGAELAAHVVLPDANPGGGPVDVAPAQRDELALAQTGQRRGEPDGLVELLEDAGGGRA